MSHPGNCGICGRLLTARPKNYRCENCQPGSPILLCATCFEAWKENKGLCTKEGCQEYNAKVLAQREAAKQAKAKPPAAAGPVASSISDSGGASSSSSVPSAAATPSPDEELATLAAQFGEQPTCVVACAMAEEKLSKLASTRVVIAALKATRVVASVPGVSPKQMILIFTYAFARNSTVVLGGSRVRSHFSGATCHSAASDLDLGNSS